MDEKHGEGHISTANTISNLATVYQSMGRYAEAAALCERALKIYETAFGVDGHPNSQRIKRILQDVQQAMTD